MVNKKTFPKIHFDNQKFNPSNRNDTFVRSLNSIAIFTITSTTQYVGA